MVTGEEFLTSRGVLEAKRKQLKSRGKGNKPLASDPITAEHVHMFWDKRQLGPHDGKTIQNTVFFYLDQGFGFRGNHESRQLCWGNVKLKSDEKGVEFLVFNERLTKPELGVPTQVAGHFSLKYLRQEMTNVPFKCTSISCMSDPKRCVNQILHST